MGWFEENPLFFFIAVVVSVEVWWALRGRLLRLVRQRRRAE
jgi:hypothetical protein